MSSNQKLKLYIIIREDLDPTYGAVQAGHAVAAMFLKYPEEMKLWNNNTLIYVTVEDSLYLGVWTATLARRFAKYEAFFEPDINQYTVVGCLVEEGDHIYKFLNKKDLFGKKAVATC